MDASQPDLSYGNRVLASWSRSVHVCLGSNENFNVLKKEIKR
jgi:hypothetical protein